MEWKPEYGAAICMGIGVMAALWASFCSVRLRNQHRRIVFRAKERDMEVPPLVGLYFRKMVVGLQFFGLGFLASSLFGMVLLWMQPSRTLITIVGFVSAGFLALCGITLLFQGFADTRLKLDTFSQRALTLLAGGGAMAAACWGMIMLVQNASRL